MDTIVTISGRGKALEEAMRQLKPGDKVIVDGSEKPVETPVTHRYGCHNKPRPTPETTHTAQSGWIEYEERNAVVRVPVWIKIPHRFDDGCKYDKSDTDRSCEGCVHKVTKKLLCCGGFVV